jgi:hypothetical protein
MFFKHNDSLERRVWLGIGEALLAAYVFGTLYLLPSISFWKYRSDGDSLIHDLAQFFPELIVSGFFCAGGELSCRYSTWRSAWLSVAKDCSSMQAGSSFSNRRNGGSHNGLCNSGANRSSLGCATRNNFAFLDRP